MPTPRSAERFDPDRADGALEIAELAIASTESYHAAWTHLHPDDQREFLEGLQAAERQMTLLLDWHHRGWLEPEQAARLADLVRLQRRTEALVGTLRLQPLDALATGPGPHPMVLDDEGFTIRHKLR